MDSAPPYTITPASDTTWTSPTPQGFCQREYSKSDTPHSNSRISMCIIALGAFQEPTTTLVQCHLWSPEFPITWICKKRWSLSLWPYHDPLWYCRALSPDDTLSSHASTPLLSEDSWWSGLLGQIEAANSIYLTRGLVLAPSPWCIWYALRSALVPLWCWGDWVILGFHTLDRIGLFSHFVYILSRLGEWWRHLVS